MHIQKLRPGLWRWTALHPEWTPEEEWGEEVACLYLETEDSLSKASLKIGRLIAVVVGLVS